MLIFFVPAGIEGFFERVSAPLADVSAPAPEIPFEETLKKAQALASEYGLQFDDASG
jgi:hypothetical protein